MASKDESQQPVVIRKKKKNVHADGHGGAWKVAYADFVTAMMAFFLLMWLLNASTKEQQSGIADYFSPTTASESTSGGGGVLSGQTVSKDGALTSRNAPIEMNIQAPAAPPTKGLEGKEDRRDAKEDSGGDSQLDKVANKIQQSMANSPELRKLQDHISIERTERGLKIRIHDRIDGPMFEPGTANPLPRTREILAEVAANIGVIDNRIVIEGHTDATSFGGGAEGYSNWELSSERANATRQILVQNEVGADRVVKVVGMAAQNLLLPREPASPRNRRIAIVLLRDNVSTVVSQEGGGVPSGATAPETREAPQEEDGGAGGDGGQTPQQDGGPSLLDETGG